MGSEVPILMFLCEIFHSVLTKYSSSHTFCRQNPFSIFLTTPHLVVFHPHVYECLPHVIWQLKRNKNNEI